MINSTQKGDQLEERVAAVLRLFCLPANVKVKHSVMDNTVDSERKIDVVVIEDDIKVGLAVECKNHQKPVAIGDIEKWKAQCDDMKLTNWLEVLFKDEKLENGFKESGLDSGMK